MGILRFLLAISVVLSHTSGIFGCTLVGGPIAVEAFFIISGFYMSLILNEKYIHKNGSYKLFITNRLLRLFPIYWCVLILVVIFSVVIGIHSHGAYWSSLDMYAKHLPGMKADSILFVLFTNVFIFFQDLIMFFGLGSDGHAYFTSNYMTEPTSLHSFLLIPQAWTLGIELAFYLVAPFIVRKKVHVFLILICCSLLVRYFLYRNGLDHDPWTYRFFPAELFYFLLGALAYKLYKVIRVKEIKRIYLDSAWIIIVAFTLFYGQLHFPQQERVYFLLFFLALPFIFLRTKDLKIDAYIGELSYPIYISHIFILTLLHASAISFPGGEGLALSISTILFSIMLNELIAKRIERMRQERLLANK